MKSENKNFRDFDNLIDLVSYFDYDENVWNTRRLSRRISLQGTLRLLKRRGGEALPIVSDSMIYGNRVFTYEWHFYSPLSRDYHQVVNHGANQYISANAHTNNIESFMALLKSGIVGIYHHTSDKHCEKHVNDLPLDLTPEN